MDNDKKELGDDNNAISDDNKGKVPENESDYIDSSNASSYSDNEG